MSSDKTMVSEGSKANGKGPGLGTLALFAGAVFVAATAWGKREKIKQALEEATSKVTSPIAPKPAAAAAKASPAARAAPAAPAKAAPTAPSSPSIPAPLQAAAKDPLAALQGMLGKGFQGAMPSAADFKAADTSHDAGFKLAPSAPAASTPSQQMQAQANVAPEDASSTPPPQGDGHFEAAPPDLGPGTSAPADTLSCAISWIVSGVEGEPKTPTPSTANAVAALLDPPSA
jgi:hypothetical protein